MSAYPARSLVDVLLFLVEVVFQTVLLPDNSGRHFVLALEVDGVVGHDGAPEIDGETQIGLDADDFVPIPFGVTAVVAVLAIGHFIIFEVDGLVGFGLDGLLSPVDADANHLAVGLQQFRRLGVVN